MPDSTPSPKTISDDGKRIIPNVSIEVSTIVSRVRAAMVPGRQVEIAYETVTAWIDQDIRCHPNYLASAKRILLRDHAVLLETVRGVGLRIGTDSDKISASTRDMGRARRSLGRASKKLDAVNYAALTEGERRDFNARSSVIGALRLLGSTATVQKVAATGPSEMLPSAKVLDLLRA